MIVVILLWLFGTYSLEVIVNCSDYLNLYDPI